MKDSAQDKTQDKDLEILESRLKSYRDGRIDPVTRIYWEIHYGINLGLAIGNTRVEDAVLDVGCGAGRTLIDLACAGRKCYGVDPLWEISLCKAQENAREQGVEIGLARSQGENLPFKDEQFNMVLLLSTLQHVTNQEKTLAEIRRVLKRDGMLLISVPMSRNISTLFLPSKKPDHFTKDFDLPKLKELLMEAGFKIQKVQGCGFFPPLSFKLLHAGHFVVGDRGIKRMIEMADNLAGAFPLAASSVVVLCREAKV
jgi:2-polyprenyl-3-methyl-5-hydroxy-6-metoxy-1,4-benzoquinol methylase